MGVCRDGEGPLKAIGLPYCMKYESLTSEPFRVIKIVVRELGLRKKIVYVRRKR